MVPQPTQLDTLDIIGYADVLPEEALPRIVAPVFRHKTDSDRILLPPFRLDGNFVYGGAWDGMSRWQSLIKTGTMTELTRAILPQADHQLWIDQDHQPRYEKRSIAHKNLEAFAVDRVREARDAFARGDLDSAEKLAGMAFNADDRNIDALVVKAAIRKIQGKQRHIEFLASLAHGITQDHFVTLVENLLNNSEKASPISNVCAMTRQSAESELFALAPAA